MRGRTADVLGWLVLLVAAGAAVVVAWGTWWSVPAIVVYGALYAGAADARWHECGHGTAFRTDRWNDVVYPFASFLLFREPTVWRWSHVRHHSDTIIVGRDAEIVFRCPPSFALIVANCFNLVNGPRAIARMARHARGRIDPDVADYVPADEHRRVVVEARVFLAVLGAVIVVAVATRSLLPLVLVGLPTFYGVWMVVFFGMTQHAGLAEDVLDHRRNTRTVRMNPVFRFLYLNMNHHTEHHLFPTVPYHRLPALHATVGDQLAPPLPSTWAANRGTFPRPAPTARPGIRDLARPSRSGPRRAGTVPTGHGRRDAGHRCDRAGGGPDEACRDRRPIPHRVPPGTGRLRRDRPDVHPRRRRSRRRAAVGLGPRMPPAQRTFRPTDRRGSAANRPASRCRCVPPICSKERSG